MYRPSGALFHEVLRLVDPCRTNSSLSLSIGSEMKAPAQHHIQQRFGCVRRPPASCCKESQPHDHGRVTSASARCRQQGFREVTPPALHRCGWEPWGSPSLVSRLGYDWRRMMASLRGRPTLRMTLPSRAALLLDIGDTQGSRGGANLGSRRQATLRNVDLPNASRRAPRLARRRRSSCPSETPTPT